MLGNFLEEERQVQKSAEFSRIYMSMTTNMYMDDLSRINSSYMHAVIHILSEFYANHSNQELRRELTSRYVQAVAGENFISDFEALFKKVQAGVDQLVEICKVPARITSLCEQIKYNEVVIAVEKNNFEYCPTCNRKMDVNAAQSQLQCPICGYVTRLLGVVFEDYQFYNQDSQKTKHGQYVPSRHYKFWRERIHAKEKWNPSPEAIEKIRRAILADGLQPMDVTYPMMRKILKECNLTTYNDHTSFLIKKLSDGRRAPPEFTFDEDSRIEKKYNLVMDLYENIKDPDINLNKSYYPYFYYKICEEEFADDPAKLDILNWIHLQSEETVIKNDMLYKKICESSDGNLTYNPTKIWKYLYQVDTTGQASPNVVFDTICFTDRWQRGWHSRRHFCQRHIYHFGQRYN